MILLLLRECSCLLTKYLSEGAGLPGNPVHLRVCRRSAQNRAGYGSPWVFISGLKRVAQRGHCFWQVILGKSRALPLGDLGGSLSASG